MPAKADVPILNHLEEIILILCGHKVLIDSDLAALYGVDTKTLKRSVRRSIERFPADFMFQLSRDEANSLRRQFGALKRGQNFKYLPLAFTEQGVAILSSVLNSPRAIQVNIGIMRVFVRLRETLSMHKESAQQLAPLEEKIEGHDEHIRVLFDAIRQLTAPPPPPTEPEEEPHKEMGFHVREEEAPYRAGRRARVRG